MHGRKMTPWAKAIGLSNGDISRMKAGHIPGPDKLTPICRAENLSLSWLLEGIGAPFLVEHAYSDEETAERLQDYLADEDWSVHLLDNPTFPAIVLTLPATMTVGKNEIPYTATEIIAGPVDHNTLERLPRPQTKRLALDDFTARRLYAGKIGTSELHGMLKEAAPFTGERQGMQYAVADRAPAGIDAGILKEAIERVEQTLVDECIDLTPEQKSRVIAGIYRHIMRTHERDVDKNTLITIMETL